MGSKPKLELEFCRTNYLEGTADGVADFPDSSEIPEAIWDALRARTGDGLPNLEFEMNFFQYFDSAEGRWQVKIGRLWLVRDVSCPYGLHRIKVEIEPKDFELLGMEALRRDAGPIL